MKANSSQLPDEVLHGSAMITSLVEKTKREHRFQQVQNGIIEKILAELNEQRSTENRKGPSVPL
jgi:hypothetical protein